MQKIVVFLAALMFTQVVSAQQGTKNLVIVTLDGLRWQEVFKGVDPALIANKKFTADSASLMKKFWSDDVQERRRKLFPFLWSTVESNGILLGNRAKGCMVNNANPYWFSYPGYNEIFTGYPDTAVNSNDKIENKNVNALEHINAQPAFNGKVATFATWDVFPYILNERRSNMYVNAGVDSFTFNTPAFTVLNDLQFLAPQPVDVRLDVNTYLAGKAYLQAYQPKVLYIAFDETDDYAHAGLYDQYLKTAHAEDAMIADLWKTLQSMPAYRNNTTLIVTCDHGRGDGVKEEWTSHGEKIADAGEIWIAAIGPDTKPAGEAVNCGTLYQAQLATTFTRLLGLEFKPAHPVMQPIEQITSK